MENQRSDNAVATSSDAAQVEASAPDRYGTVPARRNPRPGVVAEMRAKGIYVTDPPDASSHDEAASAAEQAVASEQEAPSGTGARETMSASPGLGGRPSRRAQVAMAAAPPVRYEQRPVAPVAAALVSRCPEPALRHVAREDPYYEIVWPSRTTVAWVARDQVDRTARRRRDFPRGMIRSREEALDAAYDPPLLLAKVLGTSQSYRTLTQAQLAAFTGELALLKDAPRVMRSSWSAGILDAYPLDDRTRLEPWGPRSIWRPSSSTMVTSIAKERFSTAEYVVATGGQPWHQGGTRARHDVLAAELALRAAEHCPRVAAVFGEPYSTSELLLTPPNPTDPATTTTTTTARSQAHDTLADITVVRDDGMRIAIELVAHVNTRFKRKAAYWAAQLGLNGRPLQGDDENGLVVLFIVAPPPGSHLRPTDNDPGERAGSPHDRLRRGRNQHHPRPRPHRGRALA